MGLYSLVLLAAIAFLTYVGSASNVTAANSPTQAGRSVKKQTGTSTERFLRADDAVDEGNEAVDEDNEAVDEDNEAVDEGNEAMDEDNEAADKDNEAKDEGNEARMPSYFFRNAHTNIASKSLKNLGIGNGARNAIADEKLTAPLLERYHTTAGERLRAPVLKDYHIIADETLKAPLLKDHHILTDETLTFPLLEDHHIIADEALKAPLLGDYHALADETLTLPLLEDHHIIADETLRASVPKNHHPTSLERLNKAPEKLLNEEELARVLNLVKEQKLISLDAQLTKWQRGGKSANDVFGLLKMKEDGYAKFDMNKFVVLEKYVAKVMDKNREAIPPTLAQFLTEISTKDSYKNIMLIGKLMTLRQATWEESELERLFSKSRLPAVASLFERILRPQFPNDDKVVALVIKKYRVHVKATIIELARRAKAMNLMKRN